MQLKIIVFHARDIFKIKKSFGEKNFSWIYLGKKTKQLERINYWLGAEKSFFLDDLLQKKAYENRQTFLDFISNLGFHQNNQLSWWASNISYRNPLTNDLYLLFCYECIFKEILSGEKPNNTSFIIFIVEDQWLYKHLFEKYRDAAEFSGRKSVLPELIKLMARGFFSRAYFFLTATFKCLINTFCLSDKNTVEGNHFIISWIEDSFFNDQKYDNKYFNKIEEVFNDERIKFSYITTLSVSRKLKSLCKKHGVNIFLDNYINLISVARAAFSTFRISKSNGEFFSYKTLLNREEVYEFSKSSFLLNLLYYYAFNNLLSRFTGKQIKIIYLFENQPWEKMLCLAVKDKRAGAELIGYQHSTVPTLLLNYFLGKREEEIIPKPNILVTNSDYNLDLLKNSGYGKLPMHNGGALRYEYLFHIKRKSDSEINAVKKVLIALPSSVELTEEMITVLLTSFSSLNGNIRFIVKFHPDIQMNSFKLGVLPEHISVAREKISHYLPEISLAVYSSSTVGLEALLAGVPVIKYYSEHLLDLDPLDAVSDLPVLKCSGKNMRDQILLALGKNYSFAETEIDLKRYFAPIDVETWKNILTTKKAS